MQIKSAVFVESNTSVDRCPQGPFPDFAFIGRSNVGKSSLINAICNRKNLAKTSSRPGKTQLINHFLINDQWYLVDLPGYGYARVSKKEKQKFQSYITAYFKERKQLLCAFVLLDIRHEPQAVDLTFLEWLGSQQLPFALVFTKADKLKPKQVALKTAAYLEQLRANWESLPPYFITSAAKSEGLDQLTAYIGQIMDEIKGLNAL
ncbi:MAG: ribosome biogenesis GTP-binding protein YihA/YsxC [Flavobacteriaceae bacterium]